MEHAQTGPGGAGSVQDATQSLLERNIVSAFDDDQELWPGGGGSVWSAE